MTHYLKNKNGDFKIAVNMGCNHPDMENNNTESIGCGGNCQECSYSIASLNIPDMLELLKRADCNYC